MDRVSGLMEDSICRLLGDDEPDVIAGTFLRVAVGLRLSDSVVGGMTLLVKWG